MVYRRVLNTVQYSAVQCSTVQNIGLEGSLGGCWSSS